MIFSENDIEIIKKTISEAEKQTSGEIRVHIEKRCRGNVIDRAAFVFKMLKMDQTAERNGVLFYLAWKDRKFAILGDTGINDLVPPDFWDRIKDVMQDHFSKGMFVAGLSEGIEMAGDALKEFFPHQQNDVNELSDDISFGKM
ncbi:MAG TPA: TPM domain-containing protein [Bacteroidia bacterium]|nr:TPM domain-containing protein [Sphingobacteriales bacterium]HPD66393.1 TPM domain-containing protein [Bacteroidia bacterium]HRS59993.1 TPM domain-containing protein [Bacteroidia bacterium]HRU69108.1 TPM domain-containing protein [Bacteroidia bacterium]